MHGIDLLRLDLNLLTVFEAIMRERHIGRAAEALRLTQPAVSHALGRLRHAFADPLFVRHARGVRPTTRADELAATIAPALNMLRAGLGTAHDFDPAKVKREVNIGASDYVALTLMPRLIARLRELAPGFDLRVRSTSRQAVLGDLRRHEIDFAIGPVSAAPDSVRIRPLFTERLVLIAKRDHPALRRRMTLERLAMLNHLLVSPSGDAFGSVDSVLREAGLSRRIAVTVPHFLAAPFIVGMTDLVAVMAERVARAVAGPAGVQVLALPVAIAQWTVGLARLKDAPGHPAIDWLEELICTAAQDIDRAPTQSRSQNRRARRSG
jgi:DNA-binding transcriptional LysR family regulator